MEMSNSAMYEMCGGFRRRATSRSSSCTSNLERFLESTTPRLPAHHLPKWQWSLESEPEVEEYFRLGELWDRYDEWSAYGAGVPIFLNGGETVIQYYVPYLSALQIYTANGIRSSSNFRNARDENDGDFEMRDSSSDSCSDSESGSLSERSLSFRSDAASEDDRLGYLCLEYFERAVPYARVPLMDKINQLARGYPELNTLTSIDLSPASWMSVAWYPIYHIPTGPTVRDLSACFLTYHTLSISFQENEIEEDNGGIPSAKTKSKDSQCITLPPFGLSTYKLQGSLWASAGCVDQQRMFALLSSADSWLKQLRVRHPDFDFFASHNL